MFGFGNHQGDVDDVALCYPLNQAISTKGNSKYPSSNNNDPLLRYLQWQADLRILEIEETKSIPYTPTSHPFVERLIGNRVVVRFGASTLIGAFFGILVT